MGALHPTFHHHADGLHVDPRTGQASVPPPPPVVFSKSQAFPGKNPNTFLDLAKMCVNFIVNVFPLCIVALNTYTLGTELNGRDYYVKWRDIDTDMGHPPFAEFRNSLYYIKRAMCKMSRLYDDRYWAGSIEAYNEAGYSWLSIPDGGTTSCYEEGTTLVESPDFYGSYWDAADMECQNKSKTSVRQWTVIAPLIVPTLVVVAAIWIFIMSETQFWNHRFGSYGYIMALSKVKKHPVYRALILALCLVSVITILAGYCSDETFFNSPLALVVGLVNILLGCQEELVVTAATLKPSGAAQLVHIGGYKAWHTATAFNEVIEDGMLVYLASGNFEVLMNQCFIASLDDIKLLAKALTDGKTASTSIGSYIWNVTHKPGDAPKDAPKAAEREFKPEYHVHHQQNCIGAVTRFFIKIASYTYTQKVFFVAMFNSFVLIWNLNILQQTGTYTFPDAMLWYGYMGAVPEGNEVTFQYADIQGGSWVVKDHTMERVELVNCRKSGFITGTFLGNQFGGYKGVESRGLAIMLFEFGCFFLVFCLLFYLSEAHRHNWGSVGFILGQAEAIKSPYYRGLIRLLQFMMVSCGVYGSFFARDDQCRLFFQSTDNCQPTDYNFVGLIAMSVLNMCAFLEGTLTRVKTRIAHSAEIENIWMYNVLITDSTKKVHGLLMDGLLMKVAVNDDHILVDTLGISPADVDKLVHALIESELHLEKFKGQFVFAHPSSKCLTFHQDELTNASGQHNKSYTKLPNQPDSHSRKQLSTRKLASAEAGAKVVAPSAIVPKDNGLETRL